MKTPLTRARLKRHLTYSGWKYALLAVLCVFGWNLYFTVTAYRPPEDKKLTVYLYAYGDRAGLESWLEDTRRAGYPEQELFEVMQLTPDDTNGVVVLSTHLFSGEGDIIVLPRDQFYTYARDGFFIPLERSLPGLADALDAAGINADKGWRLLRDPETDEMTEERHLYGLPVSALPIVNSAVLSSTEYFAGIRVSCGNEETALSVLKEICLTNPDIRTAWDGDEKT